MFPLPNRSGGNGEHAPWLPNRAATGVPRRSAERTQPEKNNYKTGYGLRSAVASRSSKLPGVSVRARKKRSLSVGNAVIRPVSPPAFAFPLHRSRSATSSQHWNLGATRADHTTGTTTDAYAACSRNCDRFHRRLQTHATAIRILRLSRSAREGRRATNPALTGSAALSVVDRCGTSAALAERRNRRACAFADGLPGHQRRNPSASPAPRRRTGLVHGRLPTPTQFERVTSAAGAFAAIPSSARTPVAPADGLGYSPHTVSTRSSAGSSVALRRQRSHVRIVSGAPITKSLGRHISFDWRHVSATKRQERFYR